MPKEADQYRICLILGWKWKGRKYWEQSTSNCFLFHPEEKPYVRGQGHRQVAYLGEVVGEFVDVVLSKKEVTSTDFGSKPPDIDSLDVWHELEKTMTREKHDEYRDSLKEICVGDWVGNKHYTAFPECATAAQKTRAFIDAHNFLP
jgi:hypothetical protein